MGAAEISMVPASGWKRWAPQSLEMPLLMVTRAPECKLTSAVTPEAVLGVWTVTQLCKLWD